MQPVHLRSAGCVFRNPGSGVSAGQLIDAAGLKGFCVGGACVSQMHANYLLNSQDASAADFRALIAHVQGRVQKKNGILLQTEVCECGL